MGLCQLGASAPTTRRCAPPALLEWRVLGGIAAAGVTITLLAASGCGSGNNDPLLPIDRFPAAYAQALCASLQHCCAENQVGFVDSDCTSGWKETIGKLAANPVLASNYDPKVATDCINRVRAAASKSCDPEPETISDAREVCQRVFVGKKAPGALCSDSLECAPIQGALVGCEGLPIPDPDAGLLPLGLTLLPAAATGALRPQALPTVRKCILIEPPSAESSCATPELKTICERDANLFCNVAEGRCKARGDVGIDCVPGGCKVGFSCSGGFCVPGGATGERCAAAVDCNTFLRCDTAAGACTDRRRPFESCSADEECSIGICDLGTKRCLRNAIATSESCRGRDPVTVPRTP